MIAQNKVFSPILIGLCVLLSGCLPNSLFGTKPTPPPFAFTQISAGDNHICGVTSEGGIKCWGLNMNKKLGVGSESWYLSTPQDVIGIDGEIASVAVGAVSSCALTNSGEVECWGYGKEQPTDIQGLGAIRSIAVGGGHACALTSGGGVKCWGENRDGQLGDGTNDPKENPVDVMGLDAGIESIVAGQHHTCAVTSQGDVKCWGDNRNGELGDGTVEAKNSPVEVTGLSGAAKSVVMGSDFTCALMEQDGVECWGDTSFSEYMEGLTSKTQTTPEGIAGIESGISSLAAGASHVCALTIDGEVLCWGNNLFGQLGDGTTERRETPVQVDGLPQGITAITAGMYYTCALTGQGWVECWGRNDYGQLGDGVELIRNTPDDVIGLSEGVAAIAAGFGHTCALLDEGDVRCWGWNVFGQLGIGTRQQHSTPVAVQGLEGVIQPLEAYGYLTCIIPEEGGLMCWGLDIANGFLGDVDETQFGLPVRIGGLGNDIESVAIGFTHVCVLIKGGGVKCVGNNDYGQLGDGTNDSRPELVDVIGLSGGVQSISSGYSHTCAVTGEGDVKCWGNNNAGQLGDGTNSNQSSPVQVHGLGEEIAAISAGMNYTCALTSGGSVTCWGENFSGQLGDGTTAPKNTPVEVRGLENVVTGISTGYSHTCAVLIDGGVLCWGLNVCGQLGDGTYENRNAPGKVVGLESGVVSVVTAWEHTCALTDRGGVKCWGSDGAGQLGLGTIVYRPSPIDLLYVKT